MILEYREKLLAVLAKLVQLVTDADDVLEGSGDAEIYAWMEDIREQLVETRAKALEKLDRLAICWLESKRSSFIDCRTLLVAVGKAGRGLLIPGCVYGRMPSESSDGSIMRPVRT
jgi:hypothetical protein